jgi:hypothetical protein
MPTISLEVIAPLISGVKGCQRCAPFIDDAGVSERVLQDELNSVPEEAWQEYVRLSGLVRELAGRYGAQLRITLVDPRSPIGFWKSLRHWVRRYPTFIVNGRQKCVGWDQDALEKLLQASGALTA